MNCKSKARKVYMFIMTILSMSISVAAQNKDRYNVAIFLYQGVELLDFAGPGEVFSAAGFNVYTVSADGKEVLSQGFLTVKPQYSITNAPTPDVIVFPGGNSEPSAKDLNVREWLKGKVAKGTTALSVCTGAQILATAGLLEGYNVTTFHNFIPALQEMLPNSKVLKDTRFVDNGNIITTAGVSAGIDGALHLVSRIKGIEAAKSTAFYMEYDKWRPEDGRVDYKNPTLQKMKQTTGAGDKTSQTQVVEKANNSPIPFEGELKDLAADLIAKSEYGAAQRMLETSIKWYPHSGGLYQQLGQTYAKLGKPAPIDEDSFMSLVESGKIDEAIAAYDKAQKQFPGWILFSEDRMNMVGYHVLAREDYPAAIAIFQLNVKAFPQSANAFDSLGEALMNAGKKKEAATNYKRSLELNPANANAKEMLAKLGI